MSEAVPGEKPGPLVHYTVNGETWTAVAESMTPRQILEGAGINPGSHYLTAEVNGRWVSFRDNPDVPIRLDEHTHFMAVDKVQAHH